MIRQLTALAGIFVAVSSNQAAVQTKTIAYKCGNTECRGYLAWDDSQHGPRPGVLVVHEAWGLNDYARQRTVQLAKLGYIAFAADMYGQGKVVVHPQEASQMFGILRSNIPEWRNRALAALDVLRSQPQCDKTKLAAIGYCFGGATVLQLAYAGADLKAAATFHGALLPPSDADLKGIKPAILVCHGAADSFIPADVIRAFRQALDRGNVKYEFVAYPGARHSFTVPDADRHGNPGLKYDKAADEDSWKRMLALFREKLGK
jgi:dienelactone hydrolase